MNAAQIVWNFPLQFQPTVIYTGIGRHGHEEISQRYQLVGQWAFHLYRYEGWLHLGGEKYPISDGTVSLIPPNCAFRHAWKHPESIHFYSLFRFKTKAKKDLVPVPLLSEVGPELNDCYQQLSESIFGFFAHPARAEACLWHYLWKIYGFPSRRGDPELHPALRACMQQMEQEPLATMQINKLAMKVGISHNQLIRLFHKHLGMSPVDYLMDQRWKRAQTLLKSTTLPPKRIALDLEFSDLSHFNKFVRAQSGKSPRKFR